MQYKLDRATYYYSLETFVSLSDVSPPLASLPRSAPLFPRPPFFVSSSPPLLFNLIIRPPFSLFLSFSLSLSLSLSLSFSLCVRRFDRETRSSLLLIITC